MPADTAAVISTISNGADLSLLMLSLSVPEWRKPAQDRNQSRS